MKKPYKVFDINAVVNQIPARVKEADEIMFLGNDDETL